MYARYIPPSKPKPKPTVQRLESEAQPTASAVQSDSAPTSAAAQPAQVAGNGIYNRYVPAAKPKPAPKASENDAPDSPSKKRKAGEGTEDDRGADVKRPRDGAEMPEPLGPRSEQTGKEEAKLQQSSDNMLQSSEPPKEKKRKREKVKKTVEPVPESDDEALEKQLAEAGRHKSVMESMARSLQLANKAEAADDDAMEVDPVEVHGLEPLPQPELVPETDAKPEYETLPPWLANPITVLPNHTVPFANLDVLPPKAARIFAEEGFENAFAVQTAAIPLLLPTSTKRPGDLLISAKTGSGKTLAYALPIVRDLGSGVVTRLRALVVLPTRELVQQAQAVFELCARALHVKGKKRVRIATAVGNQQLGKEGEALLKKETRYDPEEYAKLKELIAKERYDLDRYIDDETLEAEAIERDNRLGPWEGDVVDFFSTCDVLICTPGRLIEHVNETVGFSLDYVRWLVVDEADKFFAHSVRGWLDTILEKFKVMKYGARDFPEMDYVGVRKIILSATVLEDPTLLNQLALRRPQFIQLEDGAKAHMGEYSLPDLLREYAIRVHDVNLKPLYLLALLQNGHMSATNGPALANIRSAPDEMDSDATSSSGSSESDSDSDSDSDTSSDATSDSGETEASPTKAKSLHALGHNIPMALIFTKSNESAIRLTRLLAILSPSLGKHIATLTSTIRTSERRKTLRAFASPANPIRLVIASDLVARGVDISNLDHVINYDLPPKEAAYIHRVGRTARAGKSGSAWNLVGDEESGWFWGAIGKSSKIKRRQQVNRVRIDEMSDEQVAEYEKALATLGKEAHERRRK